MSGSATPISSKEEPRLESEVRDMKIEGGHSEEEDDNTTVKQEGQERSAPENGIASPHITISRSDTGSPAKMQSATQSPPAKEETVGGDITLKLEPGKAPKLSRSTSQKVIPRPPPLFLDEPDATDDATSTFQVITNCLYDNKSMGLTEHALECDCAEEWSAYIS
ncbi:hypothetical protein LTS18_005756 [Coniosporium uncinatum]|uniref:Uncharacterized protein n=1 Tax=Coniosporium uncinatum TaxID=93489 RepID=A0ACC3DXE5_9PEZI|nr:hypothetical protein LTS18_005756 [Coniosporium uncinatum]